MEEVAGSADLHDTAALGDIAGARTMPDVVAGVRTALAALGARGGSIGVVAEDVVDTHSYGFDDAVVSGYRSFAVEEPLPGPHVMRTGKAVYLTSRDEATERFPAGLPIVEDSPYGAAACLPFSSGGPTWGFLAVHYVGERTFARSDAVLLEQVAAVAAGATSRVLSTGASTRTSTGADRRSAHDTEAELRRRVDDLQRALTSRARIEQAKGMVMQRFAVTEDTAWLVLVRISSQSEVKIRDIAEMLVRSQHVPARFLAVAADRHGPPAGT